METKKTKERPRVGTKGVQQKSRDVDNHLERTPKTNSGQAGDLQVVSGMADVTKVHSPRKRGRLIARLVGNQEHQITEDSAGEIPVSINEFQTVEEWMEMIENMKQEPQIIQDLLPDEQGSYGVIAGRTGIGKTNLVLHLALCLATGTDFFGLECQELNVAVVAFEGDPKNLLERLKKINTTFPKVGNRLMFEVMPIQNPIQMLKDLRKKLKNSRAQVVILDPIKYLVIGDYLSPKDVAPFVQMFQEMLTEQGMSAVVTLPISKPQDSKGLIRPSDVYSIKGATEWVDSATFCLLVEKKAYSKSSDEVTMSFAKHRIASRELNDEHLTFDRETCTFKKMIEFDGTNIKMKV